MDHVLLHRDSLGSLINCAPRIERTKRTMEIIAALTCDMGRMFMGDKRTVGSCLCLPKGKPQEDRLPWPPTGNMPGPR